MGIERPEIKIDGNLTAEELKFLQSKHTEIMKNRQRFAELFGINKIIDACKWLKMIDDIIETVRKETQRDKEKIALLQAYLFDDPKEITGEFGSTTAKKIMELTEEIIYRRNTIKDKSPTPEAYRPPTLSKADFDKYFGTESFTQWTGNCYAVSVIDALQDLDDFENLIRKNVKRLPNGFEIRLPLDGEEKKQTSYVVLDEYLYPQVSITWDTDALLKEINGYNALLHAIGQKQTWKQNFYISQVESWTPPEVMVLLINKYTYYYERSHTANPNFSRSAQKAIQTMLKCFEKWKDMVTFHVNADYIVDKDKMQELVDEYKRTGKEAILNEVAIFGWPEKIYATINDYEWVKITNHALSLERVEKNAKGDVIKIIVSDPNFAWEEFELPINKIGAMSYGTWRDLSTELLGYSYPLNELTLRQRFATDDKNIDQKQITTVIEKTNEQSNNTETALRWERWKVMVINKDGKYYVSGRGKKDTYITYYPDISIVVNNQTLSLSENVFSDKYNGKENLSFQKNLYPQRLAVFINKMRHDYIDPKKWGSDSPFSIDKKGLMRFDDSIFTSDIRRIWANLLWDTWVEALRDRSLLWIKPTDTDTKQKIVDFLNKLYTS